MATEVLADDQALRDGRRKRALEQMELHDLDVLVLGREANARYVAGAQRLWTAGTRPFGPGCVLVRSTGDVHLVSTWDEGIPEDIPREHLFGITWNPGNLLAWLRGIEGASEARRVGTDSLTPRFAQLLPKVFPSAELVDAEPALQAARRVKTPEEIDAIKTALSITERALGSAVAELRPGVSERHLSAAFMESMARQGVTTPATQKVAWVTSGTRQADGIVGPQDLVAFDAGVVSAGYTGEAGRTWPASDDALDARASSLFRRCDQLLGRLLDACSPGASCSRLLEAYKLSGTPLPPFPIASGLGLGFDVPVVTRQLPKTAAVERMAPGMVLAVTAFVADREGPAVLRKEAVLVSDQGPQVLTSSPSWQP